MKAKDHKRFAMIGGFLGAGKTTSILQFARWVTERKGWKVALITNDQARGLVDTALASGGRFAVTEIGGGCFCCKSESLVEAMEGFSLKVQPDVIVGEPVGSCSARRVVQLHGPCRCRFRLCDALRERYPRAAVLQVRIKTLLL